MSISFAIYNVSKNSTRGAQSTPIQPGSLAMSLLAMPSISAENAMATVDQRNFHHPTLPAGQNLVRRVGGLWQISEQSSPC